MIMMKYQFGTPRCFSLFVETWIDVPVLKGRTSSFELYHLQPVITGTPKLKNSDIRKPVKYHTTGIWIIDLKNLHTLKKIWMLVDADKVMEISYYLNIKYRSSSSSVSYCFFYREFLWKYSDCREQVIELCNIFNMT